MKRKPDYVYLQKYLFLVYGDKLRVRIHETLRKFQICLLKSVLYNDKEQRKHFRFGNLKHFRFGKFKHHYSIIHCCL